VAKRIITAAITGSIHTPSMSPYLPITPDQIADEAVRAYDAGAAVAHIHARNPETGQPSANPDIYAEIAAKIKARCNIVLCITTGGGLGMSTQERVQTIPRLKPELASFNFGSMNFALFHALEAFKQLDQPWEKQYLGMTEDFILPNTFKTLREFAEVFAENGTQPELEVYDLGMLNNLVFMLERGHLERPVYIQFVFGILGGMPATPENLMFMHRTAKDNVGDFTWSVCAAGRYQFRMCTLALLLGGNARVGLEDNLYLDKGVRAKSNAEQVEKIVRIGKELGIEPATSDEAREILQLKGLERVGY
jgi:uncharacterized protein (DUF849 family)